MAGEYYLGFPSSTIDGSNRPDFGRSADRVLTGKYFRERLQEMVNQ